MMHEVDLTGDYRTTVYSAARRLLADGVDHADLIATYRDGKLSMSGTIGDLARWAVAEPDKGGIYLSHYKAFPSAAVRGVMAIPAVAATTLPETHFDRPGGSPS